MNKDYNNHLVEDKVRDEYAKLYKCAYDLSLPYIFKGVDDEGNDVCYLVKERNKDFGAFFENNFESDSVKLFVIKSIKYKGGSINYFHFTIVLSRKETIIFLKNKINRTNKFIENVIINKCNDSDYENECLLGDFMFTRHDFMNISFSLLKFIIKSGSCFKYLFNDRHYYLLISSICKKYHINYKRCKNTFTDYIKYEDGDVCVYNKLNIVEKYTFFLDRLKSSYPDLKRCLSDGGFYVDLDFLYDYRRLMDARHKGSLNYGYSWFQNGCVNIIKDDKKITVNHRKEFFYSYPLFISNFMDFKTENKEIVNIINENHDVLNKLIELFYKKIGFIDKKRIKDSLKILNGRLFDINEEFNVQDFIVFLCFIPECVRNEIVKFENNTSFNMMLMNIFKGINNVPFISLEEKEILIKNTFKCGLNSVIEQFSPYNSEYIITNMFIKLKHFWTYQTSIFINRVLVPMCFYIAERDSKYKIDNKLFLNNLPLEKVHLSFFIKTCKFSLFDFLHINETIEDNSYLFLESGKCLKHEPVFSPDEIKNIENTKFRYFVDIRNDKYRKVLNLSENIDWVPFLNESYDSKDGKYHIVPLLSQNDLVKESNAMKHCVGYANYDKYCYVGNCRVFTVIDSENKRKATVDVKILSDESLSLRQVLGYENGRVDDEIYKIVDDMVNDMNTGVIKIDWGRINDKTPTGEMYFASQDKKDLDHDENLTVKEACGYDYSNLTSIRAAGEPWRDVLPKNLKSMNPREYAKIPEIQNIIKVVKSMMPDD